MRIKQVFPKPESPPEVYELTLDRAEMLAISAVTGFIGGEPGGPRGVFDNISKKLAAMDFPWYKPALRELKYRIVRQIPARAKTGGIRFVPEDELWEDEL